MRIALSAVISMGLTGRVVAQAYHVTEIGPFATGYGIPTAISDAGQVVGFVRAGAFWRAWSWRLGVLTDLDPAPEDKDRWSMALGVSDDGTVVGFVEHAGDNRPVRWTRGAMELLPVPEGSGGWARDVNADGQVTGWVWSARLLQAYVWSDGAGEGLGTIGGFASYGVGISDSGVVVGQDQGLDGDDRAFRAESGVMTLLGALGGNWSTANDINDGGTIVGTWGNNSGDAWAFQWDPATGMRDLGSLPGCLSYASGLNRAGEIVGAAHSCSYLPHAVLWADGRVIDLNDAIDTSGGLSLLEAMDINDAGQIIAFATGHRAVLLTPADLGDLDRDGAVSVVDLVALLSAWGDDGAADLNHDGVTDRADLSLLLGNWG